MDTKKADAFYDRKVTEVISLCQQFELPQGELHSRLDFDQSVKDFFGFVKCFFVEDRDQEGQRGQRPLLD